MKIKYFLIKSVNNRFIFQELKAQASKVGANGIILTNIGQRSEGYVGGGAYGQPVYGGTSTYETLSGEAIYVHQKWILNDRCQYCQFEVPGFQKP